MCTAILMNGTRIDGLAELVAAIGLDAIVFEPDALPYDPAAADHDPDRLGPNTCLCPVDVHATATRLGFRAVFDGLDYEFTTKRKGPTEAQSRERIFNVLASTVRTSGIFLCWVPLSAATPFGVVLANLQNVRTQAKLRAMMPTAAGRADTFRNRSLNQGLVFRRRPRRMKSSATSIRGYALPTSYRPAALEGLPPHRRAARIPGFPYRHLYRDLRVLLGMYPQPAPRLRISHLRRRFERL